MHFLPRWAFGGSAWLPWGPLISTGCPAHLCHRTCPRRLRRLLWQRWLLEYHLPLPALWWARGPGLEAPGQAVMARVFGRTRKTRRGQELDHGDRGVKTPMTAFPWSPHACRAGARPAWTWPLGACALWGASVSSRCRARGHVVPGVGHQSHTWAGPWGRHRHRGWEVQRQVSWAEPGGTAARRKGLSGFTSSSSIGGPRGSCLSASECIQLSGDLTGDRRLVHSWPAPSGSTEHGLRPVLSFLSSEGR